MSSLLHFHSISMLNYELSFILTFVLDPVLRTGILIAGTTSSDRSTKRLIQNCRLTQRVTVQFTSYLSDVYTPSFVDKKLRYLDHLLGASIFVLSLNSISHVLLLTGNIYGSVVMYDRIHVVCRLEKESDAYNAAFYCDTVSYFQQLIELWYYTAIILKA